MKLRLLLVVAVVVYLAVYGATPLAEHAGTVDQCQAQTGLTDLCELLR